MAGASRAARWTDAATVSLTLPISGVRTRLREPTGREEVLLAEGRPDDAGLALALVQRLAPSDDDVDWLTIPVFDVDTVIMRLRRLVIGDRLASSVTCAVADCGSRVEIAFGVEAYLGHHAPRAGALRRRGWRATAPDAEGWRIIVDVMDEKRREETRDGAIAGARFRLPTLGDQIAVTGLADPATALARRCAQAEGLGARTAARIDTAMSVLAPPLAGPLQGDCPDCGAPITAWFEARTYCLRELGLRARFVYDDVDTLAERYHWSERAILALPAPRRARYAERARQSGAA